MKSLYKKLLLVFISLFFILFFENKTIASKIDKKQAIIKKKNQMVLYYVQREERFITLKERIYIDGKMVKEKNIGTLYCIETHINNDSFPIFKERGFPGKKM